MTQKEKINIIQREKYSFNNNLKIKNNITYKNSRERWKSKILKDKWDSKYQESKENNKIFFIWGIINNSERAGTIFSWIGNPKKKYLE
jgi:hypothetical protein